MLEITENNNVEYKIRFIANHYSKAKQWLKAIEEVRELLIELDRGKCAMGYEDIVSLPENTWSEIADVKIMCDQLAIQHGKEAVVREQIEFKLDRQLRRIEESQ